MKYPVCTYRENAILIQAWGGFLLDMFVHVGKRCLLDMCNCGLIPMLLLVLEVALEQELHLLGLQLHVDGALKQSPRALCVAQLDLLQPWQTGKLRHASNSFRRNSAVYGCMKAGAKPT